MIKLKAKLNLVDFKKGTIVLDVPADFNIENYRIGSSDVIIKIENAKPIFNNKREAFVFYIKEFLSYEMTFWSSALAYFIGAIIGNIIVISLCL